jgi:2-amino-4-hydroxy-6-hydroxymethyldihydropteridine diphosphokinase
MSDAEFLNVFIGLGSNLDKPLEQVAQALQELAEIPQSCLLAHSSLYRSAPVGPADQPDYINAVAKLLTRLAPEELLDQLQQLEQAHGRLRNGERWGPRSLDLDLLLYADRRIDTPRLQVPHPYMAARSFVLVPLAEVAEEDLPIPGFGRLGELLEQLTEDGLERLA